jgi:hypothetical protein
MARIWLGLLAAFAFVTAAQAQANLRIEIIEPGIYQHEVERLVEAPAEPLGKRSIVRDPKLIEPTTCIPAKRGTRFGFRYRILADQNNMFLNLRVITRFPEPGLRDPETNKVFENTDGTELSTTGGFSYTGYGFDADWEAVPGTWTFEIWHNNTLLASQKFEVGSCFRGASLQGEHRWRAFGLG